MANNSNSISAMVASSSSKSKKKAGGARLWMRFDRSGQSELIECGKTTIIKRASIPARDLRILGPVFSHSSHILAREKAMVVSLEFVKAIVTAEEVLLLDPLRQEVLPFVDQLRQQLPPSFSEAAEEGFQAESELPFELLVLEIALEAVCTSFDSEVTYLERDAYPVLDELTQNVSTKNLEHVRSLKGDLTLLLARVQKVRDEIEHLLDGNEDTTHLQLTKQLIDTATAPQVQPQPPGLRSASARSTGSLVSSRRLNAYHGAQDAEMLMEAYFVRLDGIRNKILSVREYIDDTEDYVNIQLDSKRNELIQLQTILTAAHIATNVELMIAGIFSINIPISLYNVNGIFGQLVGGMSGFSFLIFLLVLGYARWKRLLGS